MKIYMQSITINPLAPRPTASALRQKPNKTYAQIWQVWRRFANIFLTSASSLFDVSQIGRFRLQDYNKKKACVYYVCGNKVIFMDVKTNSNSMEVHTNILLVNLFVDLQEQAAVRLHRNVSKNVT